MSKLSKSLLAQNTMPHLFSTITTLFILSLVLLVAFFPPPSSSLYTYTEQDPSLEVYDAASYTTGQILLRLVKWDSSNSTSANTTSTSNSTTRCQDPVIRLRLIHLNLTITPIEFKSDQIPEINFCPNLLSVIPLIGRYFLVTYFTPLNDTTFQESGLVVNWDSEILAEIKLGNVNVNAAGQIHNGVSAVNINPDNGFIWAQYFADGSSLSWSQFSSPMEPNFRQISTGSIQMQWANPDVEVFPTVDGGYGFILTGQNPNVTTANSTTNSTNSINPIWFAQGYFLALGSDQVSDPFIIYTSPIPAYDMHTESCGIMGDGSGFKCVLAVQANSDLSSSLYLQTSFSSMGSSRSISEIMVDPQVQVSSVKPLESGGFLVIGSVNNTFTGKYYNEEGNFDSDLDFNSSLSSGESSSGTFTNDTAWLIVNDKNSQNGTGSWDLITVNFTNRDHDDVGFNNPSVTGAFPPIHGTIPLGLNRINITFQEQLTLSTGSISIYQIDNGQRIFRQNYSALSDHCTLVSGNQLSLLVLDSTFNTPVKEYKVIIDSDFAKSQKYNEPLVGVSDWTFTTENRTERDNLGTTNCALRLNSLGTSYFKLTSHKTFIDGLLNDLRNVTPVTEDRITASGRFSYDSTVSPKQMLISFQVHASSSPNDLSVSQIISSLNTMIVNMDISPVSHSSDSKFLDQEFGFVKTPTASAYKLPLLLVSLMFVLLGFATIGIQLKWPKSNAYPVFRTTIILFDVIMDFLFVLRHGQDVYPLFVPSLVFLCVPISMNIVFALCLQLHQVLVNEKYHDWLFDHQVGGFLIGLIALFDVDVLTLSHSKIFGSSMFCAPLSKTTKKRIFWGSLANLLLEDGPQLIILALYQANVVYTPLIPLLALMTCLLTTINNLITRVSMLYRTKIRYTRLAPHDPPDHQQGSPVAENFTHPLQINPNELTSSSPFPVSDSYVGNPPSGTVLPNQPRTPSPTLPPSDTVLSNQLRTPPPTLPPIRTSDIRPPEMMENITFSSPLQMTKNEAYSSPLQIHPTEIQPLDQPPPVPVQSKLKRSGKRVSRNRNSVVETHHLERQSVEYLLGPDEGSPSIAVRTPPTWILKEESGHTAHNDQE